MRSTLIGLLLACAPPPCAQDGCCGAGRIPIGGSEVSGSCTLPVTVVACVPTGTILDHQYRCFVRADGTIFLFHEDPGLAAMGADWRACTFEETESVFALPTCPSRGFVCREGTCGTMPAP